MSEILFFEKHAENSSCRELVPDLFLFYLYEVKASGLTLVLICFVSSWLGYTIMKLWNFRQKIRDKLNFEFLKKVQELVYIS